MASDDTNPWVRDRSDELALAAGMQFDAERGELVCDWIEHYLRLYEGEHAGDPVKLLPWCRDATMRLFGWIKWSDHYQRWVRRFTKASIWVAKKNAKSPLLAMWGLYLLAGDGEPGNKVFFASKTGEQIRENSVKHAAEMVWSSPTLSKEIVVNKSTMQLTHVASRSILKPLTSSDAAAAKAKEGLNGSILCDETHVLDDAFIKDLSASIQPGNAALFLQVHKITADKVLEAISGTGGMVLKTSLDHTKEQALRDALAGVHQAEAAKAAAE
jgi:phage terminase large subunit-like protein